MTPGQHGERGQQPVDVLVHRAEPDAGPDRRSPAASPAVAPPPPGESYGATGRRKSAKPLIEIARAATKAEAMEGLERWKARHPAVWAHLEPADVLTDSMRGKNYNWTRIRVNLEHVPEAERPAQEALEVTYDPWQEEGRRG